MKKFEYDIHYNMKGDLKTYLNMMGNSGWELVQIILETSQYIWKRALPESNDKTETK